jgi:ribosomal protein S2
MLISNCFLTVLQMECQQMSYAVREINSVNVQNFDTLHYTKETKYMLLSRHQNAGQNQDIKICNRCFENVAQLRYLGTTVTNQNLIQEEIKRRLSSRLLSRNLKTRIYKTIILPSRPTSVNQHPRLRSHWSRFIESE